MSDNLENKSVLSAQDTETPVQDAETSAQDAEMSAQDAETSAQDAEMSAQDAETSAQDAETSVKSEETPAAPPFRTATVFLSIVALLLAAALFLSLFGGLGAGQTSLDSLAVSASDMDFNSPLAAVSYFTDRLSSGDVGDAIKAFAVQEAINHYDLAFYAEKNGQINLLAPDNLIPAQYELGAPLNEAIALGRVANQIKALIVGFALPGTNLSSAQQVQSEATQDDTLPPASAMSEALDPSAIKGLKLLRLDSVTDTTQTEEQLAYTDDLLRQIYGYQERADYLALYELNGETYCGGFIMMRFEDGWVIYTLMSSVAGHSYGGIVIPVTEEEYMELVAG